jgi:hypothetical protein
VILEQAQAELRSRIAARRIILARSADIAERKRDALSLEWFKGYEQHKRKVQILQLLQFSDVQEYLAGVRVVLLGGPSVIEQGSSLSREGIGGRINQEIWGIKALEALCK